MEVFLVVLALIGLFYVLHRVALWAEGRGWVYYLNSKPSNSALGNAFLEIQSMIEPDKRQLVEERKEEAVEEGEQGEPPEAGGN